MRNFERIEVEKRLSRRARRLENNTPTHDLLQLDTWASTIRWSTPISIARGCECRRMYRVHLQLQSGPVLGSISHLTGGGGGSVLQSRTHGRRMYRRRLAPVLKQTYRDTNDQDYLSEKILLPSFLLYPIVVPFPFPPRSVSRVCCEYR